MRNSEPWVRNTREPTVLSRVSCRPFHLNIDRFHQPCLLPRCPRFLFFGFCWIVRSISRCLTVGIVISLCCWTWRDTTRCVLRERCRGRTCARAGGTRRQSWDNNGHDIFRTAQMYFPMFGSAVVFGHWPTRMNIRVLRRACLTTGLQACPRGFAPSRRAQGRERIRLLPHLFALLHWLWQPFVGFLQNSNSLQFCWIQIFLAQHVHGCSRIYHKLFSSGFFEDCAGDEQTSESEKNVALTCPCCWAFSILMFRQISCCKVSFFTCAILEVCAHLKAALLRFTFLNNSLRWTLSFPNFTCRNGPFEKPTVQSEPEDFVLFRLQKRLEFRRLGVQTFLELADATHRHVWAPDFNKASDPFPQLYFDSFCWADCQLQRAWTDI